ncbi:MAG: ParB/RepB/Spo0J family partition protein [Clostridia bacterium]|nr:ParB/RepB/Spo0J family partition protein [Clostridia bacterium]
MSDSVRKIKISSYDDLFTPTDSSAGESGTPLNIDVEKLVPFPHHPFKLYQEDKMQEMVQSIRNNGVLTPILVRPNAASEGYEIISGHNRVSAARLAGLASVPAIIRNLDDESAIVAMVDSNLRQRDQLLPSE